MSEYIRQESSDVHEDLGAIASSTVLELSPAMGGDTTELDFNSALN